MLSANFSESHFEFLKQLLSVGRRTDWDSEWYTTVGPTLIQTMLIQCFTPVIEFVVSYSQTKVFQWIDRGFTSDLTRTKTKTVYAHTDLYAGPEYLI
jgi:hypothetical protein